MDCQQNNTSTTLGFYNNTADGVTNDMKSDVVPQSNNPLNIFKTVVEIDEGLQDLFQFRNVFDNVDLSYRL